MARNINDMAWTWLLIAQVLFADMNVKSKRFWYNSFEVVAKIRKSRKLDLEIKGKRLNNMYTEFVRHKFFCDCAYMCHCCLCVAVFFTWAFLKSDLENSDQSRRFGWRSTVLPLS